MTAVASTRSAIPSAPPGVQLPLHHSHDTPAKQWNKTRVLALAVVARVLRRYPETRIASRAVAGWGRALAAAAAAAAATEPEVAAAGVSAVLDLLAAAAAAAVACTRAVGEAGGGGGGINGGGGGWVSVFLSAAGATANGGTGAVAAAAPAADATPPDADEHLAMATALWHSVWEAIDGVVPVARSVDSPLPPGCDPSPPPPSARARRGARWKRLSAASPPCGAATGRCLGRATRALSSACYCDSRQPRRVRPAMPAPWPHAGKGPTPPLQ